LLVAAGKIMDANAGINADRCHLELLPQRAAVRQHRIIDQ
jgi:hypothetical protein